MKRRLSAGRVAGVVLVCACVMTGTLLAQKPAAPAAAKRSAEAKLLKNPVAASAESVETGRRRFIRWCASCHGIGAKGDGKSAPEGSHPADLTDAKWDHGATDGELFVTIRDGVGPKFDMDAWEGKLPDQEVWSIINYIRTLNPKTAAKP